MWATVGDQYAAAAQVLAVYTAAVDARSADAIAATLTSDVRLTRGETTVHGVDAFIEAYRPFLDSDVLGSRHVVTNLQVASPGPDALSVHSCFEATTFTPAGTRRIVGRYHDDLVLVDDRWLISHKRNIMEWSFDLPPATRL